MQKYEGIAMLFDFLVLFVIIIIEMQMAADRRLALKLVGQTDDRPKFCRLVGGHLFFREISLPRE